jgi:hypothetical protein
MSMRGWLGLAAMFAVVSFEGVCAADPPHINPQQLHHLLRLSNVADPINPRHIAALRARPQTKCGAREVAPNVWVKVDCHPYTPIANAKPLVLSQIRMQMLQTGKIRTDSAAAPVGADGSLPDSVDHRQNGTEGPIKNQEYTSACTGFSLSATMDNAILRLGASDVTSPTHIWAHYGEPAMGAAANGNLNKPIALWGAWPFSPKEACELSRFDDDCGDHYGVSTNSAGSDPKIQGELTQADSSGKYKITSIEKMSLPADPNEVAAVLASGADLWVAFSLDVNNWGYRALQEHDNVIPDWSSPEGGHAVMLAGFRKVNGKKQFLIHNSWGTDWGDSGYAWVSENMVRRFMHAAYKIKVSPVGTPPPAPLTDDDCDSDELVDAQTNQCAPECDDGSRPSGGKCGGGGGGGGNNVPTDPGQTSHKAPVNGTCPANHIMVRNRCVARMIFH